MSQKLLVATFNKGKIAEFSSLLADLKVSWLGLDDVAVTEEVAETGTTMQENAVLKARRYAEMAGLLTLADDSGLEVDALNGRPGVLSARYGGPGLTPAERYQHLLQALAGVPSEQRTARFRCVVALADEDGTLLGTALGTVDGQIAAAPAGTGGFGYDPIFYLPQYGRTMAQIPAEIKNQISHRARAVTAIASLLRTVLPEA